MKLKLNGGDQIGFKRTACWNKQDEARRKVRTQNAF